MTVRCFAFLSVALACCISPASDWNYLLRRHINNTNTRVQLSRGDSDETQYYSELADLRDESAEIAQEVVDLIRTTEVGDPIRFMALDLILTNKFSGEPSFTAAQHLVGSKLDDDQLAQICRGMAFGYPGPSPASEAALRSIIDNTDSDELESIAKLCLARILRTRMEDAAAVQRLSKRRYHVVKEIGSEHAARMLKLDLTAARNEALQLLNKIQGKLGDRKLGERPLNDIAAQELHAAKRKTIGCLAPTIAGNDTSGTNFELTDYDGRVRVLLFWGHWCVPCRKAYPLYRSLVSEYPESAFAFLGINSDKQLATINDVIEEKEVTWRCWWDEGRRIHAEWNLTGAPHIYVLDKNRRIAFVDVRGEELREAVALLTEEERETKE